MNKVVIFLSAILLISGCEGNQSQDFFLNFQKIEDNSTQVVFPPNEKMMRLAEFTCYMSVLLFYKDTIELINASNNWRLFSLEAGKNDFQKIIKLNITEREIIWPSLNIQTPLGESGKIIFPETLSSKEVKYDRLFLKRSGKKIEIILKDDRATCHYPVENFKT